MSKPTAVAYPWKKKISNFRINFWAGSPDDDFSRDVSSSQGYIYLYDAAGLEIGLLRFYPDAADFHAGSANDTYTPQSPYDDWLQLDYPSSKFDAMVSILSNNDLDKHLYHTANGQSAGVFATLS